MSRLRKKKYDYPAAAGRGTEEAAIHTGTNGLTVGLVSITTLDREIPAYFARPNGDAYKPIVIVLSEAFGLHEHIRDIARRFAQQGYFAVAPDLMVRQGNPASFDTVDELVQQLLLNIPDSQVISDLDASLTWAVAQGANEHAVSAVGFCWGGRWTWLYAAHRKLAGAVAFYGILDGNASGVFPRDTGLFPHHPIELGNDLQTMVLGLHGGQDEAIPLPTIEAMIENLGDGNEMAKRSQLIVYPAAPHAFFADYRGSYDAAAASNAWKQCLEWIKDRTESSLDQNESNSTLDDLK